MRITKGQLDRVVTILNEVTGNPVEPYKFSDEHGHHKAQPGNFHIDHCYGGYQLVQMCNEGGGIRTIMPFRGTKSDCYNVVYSMLNILNWGNDK